MEPPKILHLIWTFRMAGAERIAQTILERCAREGWEAHACALAPSDSAAREGWTARGIRVHEAIKGTGLDFTLPFRLRKLFSQEQISILHTHNAVSGFYGSWALGQGMRHVHTEHSNIPRNRKLLNFVRARQLRSAALVAVSRKVAVTLSRSGGIPESRIRVIYNGVPAILRTRDGREQALRELGIPLDSTIVGTLGNLRAVKDHHLLLTAFAQIARERNNAHLLIVGEGDERKSLESRIRQLGLEGRVSLPGHRSDIGAVLNALDVFVLSSRSEGLPVSLLEAMACGLPCVSTAVGGIPEITQEGENGLLVPAGSPEALARGILRLLNDPAEATRLGERAQETVHRRFDETRMVNEYLDIYRENL